MNAAANICEVTICKFKERSSQNILRKFIDSRCFLGSKEFVFYAAVNRPKRFFRNIYGGVVDVQRKSLNPEKKDMRT